MPEWTVTELLAAVKRGVQLPDANGALSDEDILKLAQRKYDTVVWPLLLKLREEFAVVREDQAVTAGQQAYPIPWRASIGVIRDVTYRPDSDDRGVPLVTIPLDELGVYEKYRNPSWDAPYAMALEDNDILLVPIPDTTRGELRVRYYKRPGRLVEKSRAGSISAVSGTAVTLASSVVAFNADLGPVSVAVDVFRPTPPFWGVCSTTVTIDGTSVTWPTNAETVGIEVGDYLTLEDEAVVITLPAEWHAALESATMAEVYKSLGHRERMTDEMQDLAVMLRGLESATQPRVQGGAKKLVRGRSPLRRGKVRGVR